MLKLAKESQAKRAIVAKRGGSVPFEDFSCYPYCGVKYNADLNGAVTSGKRS